MMTRHKVPQLRTLRLRHFATIFLDVIYSYIHTAWLSSAVPHLAPASHLQGAEDPTWKHPPASSDTLESSLLQSTNKCESQLVELYSPLYA